MFAKTFTQIAASILLHGSIVGVVLAFSSGDAAPEEQVYRVTLAEFSAPAPPATAPVPLPPQPEPPKPEPPKPELVAEPTKPEPGPEPVAEKVPEPKAKKISTKKTVQKPKPARETQSAALPPPPAPVQTASPSGPSGPAGPTLHIGGLAAYDADAVDQRPSIARRILPDYPQKARRMNVQGKVFVRLVVDTAGHPKECKIHQADPAGYFEDAALNAARKTRFIPGKVKGQPVNTVVLVPFVFALR